MLYDIKFGNRLAKTQFRAKVVRKGAFDNAYKGRHEDANDTIRDENQPEELFE